MAATFNTYPLTEEKKLASIDKKILLQLSQGKLVSGEEIGEKLGTSRAYVWKRIAALKEQGLEVIAVHGEGYRLPQGEEALDSNLIKQHLNAKDSLLRICWSLPSTNVAAMELASYFPRQEFVVCSETQTQGRGRRGKDWFSPLGGDLYMSYKIPFTGGAKSLQGLSLVIGVAIVKALRLIADSSELTLKWPNDVFFQGRKLGGILIEMCGDISGDCDAIIGVGINASFAGEDEGGTTTASIHELIPENMDRNYWVAVLINAIKQAVTDFKQQGLKPFIKQWHEWDFLFDQGIKVLLGDTVVVGRAKGVNVSGALLVETKEGLKTFYAGEVSVRKQ